MAGILCGPRVAIAAAGVVALGDETILGLNMAVWRLGADGFTYRNGNRAYPWLNPQSGMDRFEISAALTSGDPLNVDAGLGVWLRAIAAPQWGYSNAGVRAGTLDVQIREIGGDGTILGAATIQLETTGSGGGTGLPQYPPPATPYEREAGSDV